LTSTLLTGPFRRASASKHNVLGESKQLIPSTTVDVVSLLANSRSRGDCQPGTTNPTSPHRLPSTACLVTAAQQHSTANSRSRGDCQPGTTNPTSPHRLPSTTCLVTAAQQHSTANSGVRALPDGTRPSRGTRGVGVVANPATIPNFSSSAS